MAPATVDPQLGEAAMPQGHGLVSLVSSEVTETTWKWVRES